MRGVQTSQMSESTRREAWPRRRRSPRNREITWINKGSIFVQLQACCGAELVEKRVTLRTDGAYKASGAENTMRVKTKDGKVAMRNEAPISPHHGPSVRGSKIPVTFCVADMTDAITGHCRDHIWTGRGRVDRAIRIDVLIDFGVSE